MRSLTNEVVASEIGTHVRNAVNEGARVVFRVYQARGLPTDARYEPTVVNRGPGGVGCAGGSNYTLLETTQLKAIIAEVKH
jgi:hypothetical protein